MKIAFIKRNFSYYGGAEKYLSTFVTHLKKQGHEIHIFSNNWIEDSDIIFHKIKVLPFGSLMRAYSFNKNLKINLIDYDCVISFERTTCQHIYRAGEGCHRRWLEIRNQFEPFYKKLSFKFNPLHQYYLNIEREIFQKTPLIIANSKMVREEILEYYGISDNSIKVIYNGVDINRFKPLSKKEIRAIYGLPQDKKIILFVGSGFKRKGLDNLIRALGMIRDEDILLLVVGKGNVEAYMKKFKENRIFKNVKFLGTRKDIENFYALSDLFVLPTLYDPFSNATLEAMAAGIGVVTTKNNGVAELIENGKEGYVVENIFDVEELSDKIFKGLKNHYLFGIKAREKAEKFSIEKSVSDFMQCIKRFLL